MGLLKGNDSRRVDGKPETEADRKFFDLRESGYTGPIDQGGNKAEAGRAAEILADMSRRCQ